MLQITHLNELLTEAITCVLVSSKNQARLLSKLQQLKERLTTERFQLAVLGQFKRGKSTLLNALLGIDILPASVIPLTAIPAFLQSGPSLGFRVTHFDQMIETSENLTPDNLREQLKQYVTEEANPGNRLGVSKVEVFSPSSLLKDGVVLIDTPGVGSTFQHNTTTAEAILPECDAALFIVSADPPITEVEIAYLSKIRPHVEHLIVVLNKMDTLEDSERAVAAAFLSQVMTEHHEIVGNVPVFCVSGRNALRAIESHDEKALIQSGLPELESYLINFLAQNKQTLLIAAVARKASGLIGELQLEVELMLKALTMPLADLEKKIAVFNQASKQFGIQKQTAQDLLSGDQRRLYLELEEEAERLRTLARQAFGKQLEQMLQTEQNVGALRVALASSVPDFFKPELDRVAQLIHARLIDMLSIHQQRSDELVSLVQQTAADLLDIPWQAPESTEAFDRKKEPYWVLTGQAMTPSLIQPSLLNPLLPASIRKRRIRHRLLQELETLIRHNVENLRWATRQNIDDAFRRFKNSLDEALDASLEATQGGILKASERRQRQSEQVSVEIESKQLISAALKEIQLSLQHTTTDGTIL